MHVVEHAATLHYPAVGAAASRYVLHQARLLMSALLLDARHWRPAPPVVLQARQLGSQQFVGSLTGVLLLMGVHVGHTPTLGRAVA